MVSLRWVQMPEGELNEFLGTGGTGVISFSTQSDDPPFTIPVSYGYYPDTKCFYFRLGFPPDSGKAAVVDNPVAFVTHDQTPEGWRSVIATGKLEEVTDLPYDSAAVQRMWAVQIPVVDIFERSPDEVTFRHFRLVPDNLTGRKEVASDD
ncbi:pyridoxamine 5'-phosphate oxidase family protein [Haladaptatus sp. NG-WS-4]